MRGKSSLELIRVLRFHSSHTHTAQANNWERAQISTRTERLPALACASYLDGLIATLQAEGLNASAHVCERSMVQVGPA